MTFSFSYMHSASLANRIEGIHNSNTTIKLLPNVKDMELARSTVFMFPEGKIDDFTEVEWNIWNSIINLIKKGMRKEAGNKIVKYFGNTEFFKSVAELALENKEPFLDRYECYLTFSKYGDFCLVVHHTVTPYADLRKHIAGISKLLNGHESWMLIPNCLRINIGKRKFMPHVKKNLEGNTVALRWSSGVEYFDMENVEETFSSIELYLNLSDIERPRIEMGENAYITLAKAAFSGMKVEMGEMENYEEFLFSVLNKLRSEF